MVKLARQHQGAYIDALHTYREGHAPFMTVHSILAKGLSYRPDLVEALGSVSSEGMFGQFGRQLFFSSAGGQFTPAPLSAQVLQVGQVLQAAGGSLARFQVIQVDEVHLHLVDGDDEA